MRDDAAVRRRRSRSASRAPGRLSFCETIATLDVEPQRLGHDRTITFFNDWEKFDWRAADEPCDVRSGVICSPNNFDYGEPLDEAGAGVMRITALANYDYWRGLDEQAYRLEKLRWYDRITEIGRAVRARLPRPRGRHRHVHADDDRALHGPRQRRRLRRAGEAARRPHAPRRTCSSAAPTRASSASSARITSGIGMANMHCLKD